MKRIKSVAITLISILICSHVSLAQPCLPEGIEFTSQEQVDSFQVNYPGCTEILGNVEIGENLWWSDITNLDGLSELTSFGGNLTIFKNNYLTDLSGLSNVTTVTGLLWIRMNSLIVDLSGFENLQYVGGNLWIVENAELQNLDALSNVTTINGTGMTIKSNQSLTDISGIGNIDPESISFLNISFNYLLSECDIQNICDYIADTNAFVQIYSNAFGCNNLEDLINSCLTSVNSAESVHGFEISPNPVYSTTRIRIVTEEAGQVTGELFDLNGTCIRSYFRQEKIRGKYELEIDMSDVPAGVYVFLFTCNKIMLQRKILKL